MNPASRLLLTHDALKSIGDEKRPMAQLWADVFQLDSATSEDETVACLVALRAQVDFARLRLTLKGVPDHLTSPAFERLKQAASTANLNTVWGNHRNSVLAGECGPVFAWAAWALSDEEELDMQPAEMQGLCEEIAALEASLDGADMSGYLRQFVQQQLATIRAALRVYPIQGAKPLREALTAVAGTYTLDGARIQAENATASPEAKGIVAKVGTLVEKTAKVCDNLDKIRKFGEGAAGISTSVKALLLPYIN